MSTVAVVVTYNRAELLAACLDGLAAQTRPLEAIVVIDNASTDGSGDVARAHPIGADVHTLQTNLGGAGGFSAGLAWALEHHDPDWIWLMDDDTIPRPGAHGALIDAADAHPRDLAVLSSTAVWTDGRIHPMNRSRVRMGSNAVERGDAAAVDSHPIRTASFVAILLSADHCRRAGLPYADYFIWGDDTEYSGRLLRQGRGIQVHDSIVEHRTVAFASWQTDPGPRFYYDVRNKLWVYLASGSFRWWERLVYLGSAAAGWAGTIRRSGDRRTLLGHAWRGLRHGLLRRPAPTTRVLAGQGEVSSAVARVEAGR
ncbi:glycosyltransferase family 2 protein [Pseudactinotalea sp. HY160]|uniref:glycosyltransferase family 2 protein n=1 Tax=Pseudactinotalea sp. HY160 TaxID=2654490 RepID=UPI001D14E201|nr:glycosyltransferase family 2 protein [Pseudactinotalea sp. HY160]